MPTGKSIPNMMDTEVVQLFYHVIKLGDQANVDWAEVAKKIGLESGQKAKDKLKRTMKAQERTRPKPGYRSAAITQSGGSPAAGRLQRKRKEQVKEIEAGGAEDQETENEPFDQILAKKEKVEAESEQGDKDNCKTKDTSSLEENEADKTF